MDQVSIEYKFYKLKILLKYYQNIMEPCERGWRNNIYIYSRIHISILLHFICLNQLCLKQFGELQKKTSSFSTGHFLKECDRILFTPSLSFPGHEFHCPVFSLLMAYTPISKSLSNSLWSDWLWQHHSPCLQENHVSISNNPKAQG